VQETPQPSRVQERWKPAEDPQSGAKEAFSHRSIDSWQMSGQKAGRPARRGPGARNVDWRSKWPAQGQEPATKTPHHSQRRRSGVTHGAKPQCQYIVGIEEDAEFGVVRRLLGSHGKHVKEIAEKTGAKLRLRGRGSKFLEGPEQRESSDPLMLCVSAPDGAAYEECKHMLQEHLEKIYTQHYAFCRRSGKSVPELKIQLHEGAREGSR